MTRATMRRSALRRQLMLVGGGLASGALAGLASGGFLWSLDRVTDLRVANRWLIWILPLAGLLVALAYHYFGGRAAGGVRLTMTEIDGLSEGVPLRMAPLVLGGTLLTHLFGGSAGREGTALQMSAAITDGLARRLHIGLFERRLLLVVALAAGFGSVFGVPLAGVIFAMEVAPCRRVDRLSALPAAVVASFLGDRVVGWMGVVHHQFAPLGHGGIGDLGRVVIAGVGFGLCARSFLWCTEFVREQAKRLVPPVWLRPVLGGAVVVAVTIALGTRDYNGLSLPLLDRSLGLGTVVWYAFALKLVMTSLTLGSGYQGGEVTPLLVVGAALGSTLGSALGTSPALMAGVGMVAVFGAAANATLACIVMGVELFGWHPLWPIVLGCVAARLWSSPRHIYETVPRSLVDLA